MLTTSTSEDARVHLKAQTDDLHQRLHRLDVFEQLLGETLSVDGYRSLMCCFRDFYFRLDPQIVEACRGYGPLLGGYSYRPRAEMFAADVAALSGDHPVRNTDRAPIDITLPKVDSAPMLAGVIYVVDGAALGGAVMNKSVGRLLNSDGPAGRSYWDWCRVHGALQWKSALVLLDTFWKQQRNRSAIVSAAQQTFEALHDALEPCSAHRPMLVT